VPSSVDLSILVCGVHTRRSTFLPKIQDQLFGQYEALGEDDQKRVEIIVLTDNKKMMLGEKRNVMVEMAQGRYVVFVDDDDRVADHYVATLLEATKTDADAIVFSAAVSLDGEPAKRCRYSKTYRKDRNTSTEYLRIPNHICCVKRAVSLKSSYPSIPHGEDSAYAKTLLPHIATEHVIDDVLYFYDWSPDTTEAQEHLAQRKRRRAEPPKVDVVILSKASTRNLRDMTQHAIDTCISGANSLPVNVIVVEQVGAARYTDAKVIYRSDEFHFNRFANDALRTGTAPWVMVANNDLEFTDGWLHHLLAADHPAVSPRSPADGRQRDAAENETGYQNGRHFSGWCFMLARELWDQIGGLDESVSFWCSDDVVIEQLRAVNVEPMLVPESVVHHLTSKTLNTVSGAQRDKLTWEQVDVFNAQHGQDKFAGNTRYRAWKRHATDTPRAASAVQIRVIGYASREVRAKKLADFLDAELFLDDGTLGIEGNHLAALRAPVEGASHIVIVEDDAQPHPDFVARAAAWVDRFPDDLISFYLGGGKPATWQNRIGKQLALVDKTGRDLTKFTKLFHGVSYAMPAGKAASIDPDTLVLKNGVDLALGEWWRQTTGRPIIYTLPSLVDHADDGSSRDGPDGPKKFRAPRKAWRPPDQIVDW
jgi:GT2 family glycosyltransferase